MNLDSVLRCHHCQRPNTKLTHGQAYVGPQVQRVAECVDRDDCAIACILRKPKVGAR